MLLTEILPDPSVTRPSSLGRNMSQSSCPPYSPPKYSLHDPNYYLPGYPPPYPPAYPQSYPPSYSSTPVPTESPTETPRVHNSTTRTDG
ncbi:hypothetical protein Q1695_016150 [Nippostrongylus brasiliensis]|nr:hypothetical protein Q1695_016150 [Nippostrongylus brasiliensis]